jgi:hypothetical protein
LGSPNGEEIISALVGGGITSVNSSNSSPPGTSAQLAFVQQPTNVTAGTAISPAFTVDVEDSDGNIVTSDDSNVTISVASGPGTVGGITIVTAVNGVATFSDLSLDTAGTHTLRAIDNSLTSTTSDAFTVSAAAASQLVFIQDPSTVWLYGPVTPAVQVAVEDAFGNLITSGDIVITLNVSGATGVGPFTATAVNGVANFGGFSFDELGTFGLQATEGAIVSQTVNLSVIAPPTRRFLFNGVPLSAPGVTNEEREVAIQGPPAPQTSTANTHIAAVIDRTMFAASEVAFDPEANSQATPFATDDLILSTNQNLYDLLQ